jgi:hypothetical protein
MSVQRLAVWVAFIAVFTMAARISVDTDTWWHLRTGEYILENGRIPQADPFSYTRAGEPWRIPGWLVQVPLAWLYRLGGAGLLNLCVAAMVTLAFAFAWRVMEGGVFTKAFVLILGAAAAGVYWAARPYMVTFLLAAVYLWILEDWRRGRKDRRLWLPVLMAAWANSHGGFAAGFIIFGVYYFAELFRRLGERGWRGMLPPAATLILFAMLAAVCLNPAGARMLLYPFQTVSIESLQDFIQEWQSPDFHQRQVWPFAAMIFLTLGAAGASKRGLSLEDFLLFSGWGFLGLTAGRNIAVFALVGVVVLARHAAPLTAGWSRALGLRFGSPGRVKPAQAVVNGLLLAVLLAAAGVKAASIYPAAVNEAAFAEFLPVGAVEFIRESQPEGRLFNTYNWGAYLLWALPAYPVFVDGRTDLYSDEIIGQWFTAARAEPGWEAALDEWGVNLALIEPHLPLAGALEAAGWTKLYEDEVAVVYGR